MSKCPIIFIATITGLQEMWTDMCHKKGVKKSQDKVATIIMNDTFIFNVTVKNSFGILKCVRFFTRKYHLKRKLKKIIWSIDKVEFVGVNLSTKRKFTSKVKSQNN